MTTVIFTPSARNPYRLVIIGSGATEQSAWNDAYGIGHATRSRSAEAFAKQIDQRELEQLESDDANA